MIYRNFARAVSMLAFSAGLSAPVFAQAIIAPTSAVINSGGPGFGSLTETFNQAGLLNGYTPGVTNFNSYLATNPLHSLVFSGFEWFSNQNSTTAEVTYSFGSAVRINKLALWNEESSGIGTLGLSYSLDGVNFTGIGSFNPTNNPIGSNYGADIYTFGVINAQYVRFTMTDCPQEEAGRFPACAIGEVAFRQVGAMVPEPGTWAMLILGMGFVGGAMRARPRKALLAG